MSRLALDLRKVSSHNLKVNPYETLFSSHGSDSRGWTLSIRWQEAGRLGPLYLSHRNLAKRVGTSRLCRYCCKSPKLPGANFPAVKKSDRRPPIDVAPITLPRSPASLSSGNEVPHIFTRKSRVQPKEILITSAKRLLQQNRHKAAQPNSAGMSAAGGSGNAGVEEGFGFCPWLCEIFTRPRPQPEVELAPQQVKGDHRLLVEISGLNQHQYQCIRPIPLRAPRTRDIA
jgi:hypothetical protein